MQASWGRDGGNGLIVPAKKVEKGSPGAGMQGVSGPWEPSRESLPDPETQATTLGPWEVSLLGHTEHAFLQEVKLKS